MGANAQTTVPTFTAGQVLTAAQMNNSARTGVPVFADTTARDAAFDGSGEKTLAEGQLCYLENTDVVQYYDGSTWATLGPSTPGLVLVKSQTIGNAVASVTVSDAFSSTYENYVIRIDGGVGSTEAALALTLGAATTNYRYSYIYSAFNTNTVSGEGINSATNFQYCALMSTTNINGRIDVFSPNTAKNTVVHAQLVRPASNGQVGLFQGVLSDTTQYTAFTLTPSAGTMTGGTIRVYGYRN